MPDAQDLARAKQIVDAIHMLIAAFNTKISIAEIGTKILTQKLASNNSQGGFEKSAKKRLDLLTEGWKKFDAFVDVTEKMEVAATQLYKYYNGEYGTEGKTEGKTPSKRFTLSLSHMMEK